MPVRDDAVRLVLWGLAVAGFVMVSAALGDPGRLLSVMYAGIALTAGSSGLLLRQIVVTRHTATALRIVDVVDIGAAPGAQLLATENSARLDALEARADCHAIHLHGLYRTMMNATQDDEDGTQPMPRLRLAGHAERERGSAGLCPVGAGAPIAAGTA